MFKISNIQPGRHAEIWHSTRDSDDWNWAFVVLPILLHQDRGLLPGPYFQHASDLGITRLPFYACKIPSLMFFPYITYFVENWNDSLPSFIVLKTPLNRIEGKNWLKNLSTPIKYYLMNGGFEDIKLRWFDSKDSSVKREDEYDEIIKMSAAANTYLLDEIQFVYKETDNTFNAFKRKKINKSNRYCFKKETVHVNETKQYLSWYIEQFNSFYNALLEIGKQGSPENRTLCFVSGLTASRLAVVAITILSIDVSSIRKWQFFDFLDMLANLINVTKTSKSKIQSDKERVLEILSEAFYEKEILPALEKIPIASIRDEIILHTKEIYEKISAVGSVTENKKLGNQITGPRILWAYRNTHHGYALERDMELLLLHSGIIPDDIPDLVIALWHYLLIRFPFL